MKAQEKCPNCKSEVTIIENSLVFSMEKKEERALCPNCKEVIYIGKTDGWYFVGDSTNKKQPIDKCTYPMP